MVLPTKHLSWERTLAAIGVRILPVVRQPSTVSELWDAYQSSGHRVRFDDFILALDFLYTVGAVTFESDTIVRADD